MDMFMSTLQGPYLEKMVGSSSFDFSYLVVAGEHIENCLKNGEIQDIFIASNGAKKPYSKITKKNEWEINIATITKGKLMFSLHIKYLTTKW